VYELCAKYDFKLGWHTWSHRDLTKLTRDEILEEVTPPFPMQYFAYPYGTYNDLVIECVKEVGFKVAYSVTQGSQDRTDPDYHFKIYRDYIR
jgi:peptidoglycan/xylan/chitin deacetylase (PgdA/CDA1 family)